jgi:inosine-uridine nucleoside N-ribohydrolase
LRQERAATRVVLDSGVPLVLLPCMGVTSHLRTTVPELECYIPKSSEVGQFLLQRFKEYHHDHVGWSKEIWDLAPVAYLLEPAWVPSLLTSTPKLNDDLSWQLTKDRHRMRLATFINRDAVFRDLFLKLT